jgi:uncharacterized protein YndB with AHSA1/START domain
MHTSHPVFTTRIVGPPRPIFDLIADMPNYGRWLPGSEAFGGTTKVAPYPVRLGTTYLDGGPAGERPGSVTEFDPPRRICFHHTMLLRKGPLRADIDVHVHYALAPEAGTTVVVRTLDLTIEMRGWQKLALPFVLQGFRKENLRIMAELKRYIEGPPRAS